MCLNRSLEEHVKGVFRSKSSALSESEGMQSPLRQKRCHYISNHISSDSPNGSSEKVVCLLNCSQNNLAPQQRHGKSIL